MNISKLKQQPMLLSSYGKREVRTQFGALCWRERKDEVQVLLVSSRRSGRWILPKGWPMHGQTPADAAATEAWEEGGVRGKVSPVCLGIYSYHKIQGSAALPCVVAVFPLKVTREAAKWPESHERKRRWVSRKKAATLVDEPELQRLIKDFDPGIGRS